jgi:hypothetical protein
MRPEPQHGTISGYQNIPCREQCCRDAQAAYRRRLRAIKASQPLPSYIEHGTLNASQNYRCSCLACKDADAAAKRAYRRRLREAAASP